MLVLVTGAATGLGLATAQVLVAEGHDHVVHARDALRVQDHAVLDRVHGAIYTNLARLEEAGALAERVNAYGQFGAVIHNAGVSNGADMRAVNALAPFVLAALMRKPHRLILLSSSLHRSGSTRLRGLGADTQRASL